MAFFMHPPKQRNSLRLVMEGQRWVGCQLRLSLFLLCFWLGLFGWSVNANAAEAPDLLLLRDVICNHETRGEADPDDAIGAAGEIGRCQIKPSTARQVGYVGKNRDLFSRTTNEYIALVKLAACARKYITVQGLAWCYNRGLNAGKVNVKDGYVQAVWQRYKQRKLVAQR